MNLFTGAETRKNTLLCVCIELKKDFMGCTAWSLFGPVDRCMGFFRYFRQKYANIAQNTELEYANPFGIC